MGNRFEQLLGLATKAGKTVSGEFPVEQAVKKQQAYLVILANDASGNTRKHFQDMCSYRGIPVIITNCSKTELAKYTGKSGGETERASAAVLDQGFAEKLISIIREGSI